MSLEASIDQVYRRIEAQADNPVFIHLLEKEHVIRQAREVAPQRGLPLNGRIFAVKDNIDVAGMPTTAACPAFAHTAQRTAPSVQKLLDAGAILVGKTNLDQFATGLVGTRSPYGACRNAFDPAYISGGSSSGSALAVAFGIADFALGTDTAGSGRVPAAFANLVGLKPTRGVVSNTGVVPACRSLDCVSVFARTCKEALEVLEVIEGFDPADPYSRTGAPPPSITERFAFAIPESPEFFGDQQYARLFAQAVERLRSLGGAPRPVGFEAFMEVASFLYGPWVAERTADLGKYLPDMLPVTRSIIAAGEKHSATDLFLVQHRLAGLKRRVDDLLASPLFLVVPSAPTIYRISEIDASPVDLNARLGLYTNFVNLLDLAAVSVPAGFRSDGLPFGITLIGPAFSERALGIVGARFLGERL